MAVKKEVKIRKRFSFSDLLLSAIGSTIGAGVFVLLPFGINMAGLGIIISLLFASFITILVAFNYGELAASLPLEGGGYSWVAKAFRKDSSSFIVGWLVWLGNMGYIALSALGFSMYFGMLLNIPNPIPLALLSLLFFMILNTITMRTSIRIEKILTIDILIVFLIFWIYMGTGFNPTNIQYALYQTKFIPIFTTASLLYVLFIGFEAISAVSAEAKKPTDLPKSFIYCIIIVTLVYVITSLLIIGFIFPPNIQNQQTPLLDISGPLAPFIVLAASFATLTSMNAGLIAASRNAYALSRDGMIPKFIKKVSRKFSTPFIAIIMSGLISGLFIMTNAVEYVASIADFGYLVCISMVCSSVIFLRITKPKLKRPYRVPLYPYTSLLGIILPLFLLLFLEKNAINTGLLWILIGLFIYNFYKLIKGETRKKKGKLYKFLRRFV
ncbi:MAG: amino acid permease [Candidatus Aenigmarchaeota archaeon]|nr:amino acid permease [Candidatus Aenigmarchaeota archaeon]